ncbi:branched-chain amino acid ABC transporter substrate-binding protein [Taklimakanibacter lacteus]|uniref:branched-chain amino acid ABC transporter substrate-binding protein n=1 Tax=Taklimakanibacter lacteus TaxID=2268456 RepID=UPI000E67354B
MRRIFVLACSVLLAAAMHSAAAAAKIQIGVVGPMSGPYSAFGAQLRRGAQMAVDEINAAGGIDGEKLALVVGDDRCEADRAVTVADNMVAKKVVLVVGHFCSGASIDASKVYALEKIVQISPASTNPVFTERRPGPGVFRVVPSDRKQAEFAGNYIAKKFAGKKIAIVGDDSNYGSSLALAVRKAIEASGQALAASGSYAGGQKDFVALVADLKAAKVDVVYAGGYHTEIGLLVREMRKQGMTAQLIASDALVTREFWVIARRASEGTLMSFMADPRKNAGAAAIVKKFKARKIVPEGYTLHSYEAVKLWADAAKSAASTDFDRVVSGLMKVDADTPIGRVRFDNHGDLMEPQLVWYVWRKGKYAPLKSAASGN